MRAAAAAVTAMLVAVPNMETVKTEDREAALVAQPAQVSEA
jgi:hypothetical protein